MPPRLLSRRPGMPVPPVDRLSRRSTAGGWSAAKAVPFSLKDARGLCREDIRAKGRLPGGQKMLFEVLEVASADVKASLQLPQQLCSQEMIGSLGFSWAAS